MLNNFKPVSYLDHMAAASHPGKIGSPLQGVLSCLRLLTTSNLLLLAFVFLYSGLETSFWAGSFPSSVSFTGQLASRKMVRRRMVSHVKTR